MATGDKLVTLDELKAVKDYITPAHIGAVNKTGDTITGNLGIKAAWPSVQLYANGGSQETGSITSHKDNGRVYITEHSTDGTKEEYYQLPIADGTGTFQILTTKIPVTSSQGGTGGPYFFTCSGKTSLTVKSSNGWGGFVVMSITSSSAHLTAVGFNGTNAPYSASIYGGDSGLNPQRPSSNTITCTLRSDRHYIIIGTDKVTSISAS